MSNYFDEFHRKMFKKPNNSECDNILIIDKGIIGNKYLWVKEFCIWSEINN